MSLFYVTFNSRSFLGNHYLTINCNDKDSAKYLLNSEFKNWKKIYSESERAVSGEIFKNKIFIGSIDYCDSECVTQYYEDGKESDAIT